MNFLFLVDRPNAVSLNFPGRPQEDVRAEESGGRQEIAHFHLPSLKLYPRISECLEVYLRKRLDPTFVMPLFLDIRLFSAAEFVR